jgi:hypothetical protein
VTTNGPVTQGIALTVDRSGIANPKRVRVDADGTAVQTGPGSASAQSR